MPATLTSDQQRNLLALRQPQDDDQNSILSFAPTVAASVGLGNVASNGAAQREATSIVQGQPDEMTVKTYSDPETGEKRHDITIKGVSGAALSGTDPVAQVQAARDAPQQSVNAMLADLTHSLGRKLPGEGTQQDATTWRGRYDLERELHANPLTAAVKASVTGVPILRPGLERSVDTQRFLDDVGLDKQVQPILAEQHRQNTEDRMFAAEAMKAAKEHRDAQDKAFAGIAASGQADSLGSTLEEALANAAVMVPGGMRPDQAARFPLLYRRAKANAEKERVAQAQKTISGISPASIQMDEDPGNYVKSLPGADQFTPQEQASALSRATASQRSLRMMDSKDRMRFSLDAARLQNEQQANQIQSRALAQQDPKAMDALTDRIVADPKLYYSLQKDNDKGSKQALQQAVIQKTGRIPNDIPDQDHQRLISTAQGEKNLDTIDQLAGKWQQLGHPITGAAVGRINEKTGQIGASDLASLNVPYKFVGPDGVVHTRTEYLRDLGQVKNAMTNATLLEVRALIPGRPAAQLAQWVKDSSPQLYQDGPILAGATTGLRNAYRNARTSILESAWGGTVPTAGGAATQTPAGSGPTLHWNTKTKNWE